MFIGAGIKAFKGLKEAHELPGKIEALERELSVPIVAKYSGAVRFEIASHLADSVFLREVEADPVGARRKWKETVEREFTMAKEDLEIQPATKADVAVVGIALKELALNLDEHVKAFHRSSEALLEETKAEAGRQREELRAKHDEAAAAELETLKSGFVAAAERQAAASGQSVHVLRRNMNVWIALLALSLVLSWTAIGFLAWDEPAVVRLRQSWFPSRAE